MAIDILLVAKNEVETHQSDQTQQGVPDKRRDWMQTRT